MIDKRVAPLAGASLALVALGALLWTAWRPWTTELDGPAPTPPPATADGHALSASGATRLREVSRPARGPSMRPQQVHRAASALALRSKTLAATDCDRLIGALTQRVASLEATLRRHDELLRELQANVAPVSPADLSEEDIARLEDEQARLAEEALLEARDRIWAKQTQFESEPHDPEWSAFAALEIEQAISESAGDGTNLIGVECRSSMCRVELEYTEPQAQAQVEFAFARLSLDTVSGTPPSHADAPDDAPRTYYMMHPITDSR